MLTARTVGKVSQSVTSIQCGVAVLILGAYLEEKRNGTTSSVYHFR